MRVRLTGTSLGWKFATIAVLALGIIAPSGCYQRVVGVKGPGASAYDVYEPNVKTREEKQPDNKYNSVPTKTVPTQKAPDR
jgi:hypothetical protein